MKTPEGIDAQSTHSRGSLINHYRIVGLIGKGGMGEVYRALDTRLNREVAIKVLPTAFVQDHDRFTRFEQEARAASSLNHPNILTAMTSARTRVRRTWLRSFWKEKSCAPR